MFRPNSLSIILLASSFMAFSPISTDMFAPALPTIGKNLDASIPAVQATLSLYLIAFAFGQLFWGPLADRYGRKPIILIACCTYALASIACMMSHNIESLVIARILQGFSEAFGHVLGRAVIRDLHTPIDTPRVMAYSTMVMGTTSLVAPNIGAVVVVTLGWRVIFALLVIYTLALALIVLMRFPESIPKKNMEAIQPMQILKNFVALLRDTTFTRYTISISCIFGLLFTFISGAPFVFIDVLGVPTAQFGLVYTAIGGAFVTGTAIAGRFVTGERSSVTFLIALCGAACAGAILFLLATLSPSILGLIIPMMLVTFNMGFLIPIGMAQAMVNHPEMAGTASTLIGFIQGIFSAAMGALTGFLFDGTAIPMTALIASLSALALLSYVCIKPRIAA